MKNWKWQHIVALTFEIAGLAALVLCIATDLNDELFLSVALSCVGGANLLLLIMNIRQHRKGGK